MGSALRQIAGQLKNSQKKVQLIYAFNGTGKTRLSKEFKGLISPKNDDEESEETRTKILYYNAFTEDLFSWDNDLENDSELKLKIQPNSFTHWILQDQGHDQNIITYFQEFSGNKLTPNFSPDFSEVRFSFESGSDDNSPNVKISKGEESNFIWSIFYILLKEVISELNKPESEYDDTNPFHNLKYVFIDDPVSSLDENHLIELAVSLAQLIRLSDFNKNRLKFIISTHNPLFYNVLHNELKVKENGYMLTKNGDGSYDLDVRFGDSNQNFSYHHYLISALKQAIDDNRIEKYHFTLLRNLYEKASNFLGYKNWSELLPDDKEVYASRIMNFYSHRTLLGEEIREPTEPEKQTVKLLFNHLIDNSKFWKQVEDNES